MNINKPGETINTYADRVVSAGARLVTPLGYYFTKFMEAFASATGDTDSFQRHIYLQNAQSLIPIQEIVLPEDHVTSGIPELIATPVL